VLLLLLLVVVVVLLHASQSQVRPPYPHWW
jgi:hypothetical protein